MLAPKTDPRHAVCFDFSLTVDWSEQKFCLNGTFAASFKLFILLFDICSFFILHFCARAIAIATHDLTSDKYLQVSLPRNLV